MAKKLAISGLSHDEAIARLGQGWIAEEALAITIYCALVARNFRHGEILAVNHDGDSDSTGSIVGNPLGAMCGVKSIPAKWLAPLELRDAFASAGDLGKNVTFGSYIDLDDVHQRHHRTG